jgi:hypothetical protein
LVWHDRGFTLTTGYVFAAWQSAARLAEELGNEELLCDFEAGAKPCSVNSKARFGVKISARKPSSSTETNSRAASAHQTRGTCCLLELPAANERATVIDGEVDLAMEISQQRGHQRPAPDRRD